MGRTCLIASLAQSGQVRLVSRVMESWRWGSIHNEVPVYPKWPKELAEKYFPDCEGEEGVSHPRAREVPDGEASLRVKSARVSERRISGRRVSALLVVRPACSRA